MASGQQPNADHTRTESEQSSVEPMKMTDEERKVLKECENESFFKRALPLSCGAIVGVQFLVKTGKLAGHPKYGSLPKTIIASGLAYLAGKISYVSECRKKILEQIPESNLAMTIKKGQSRTRPDMGNRQDFYSNKAPSSDSRDDHNTGLAYPSDPRTYEGLNDSQRPSMDNEVKLPDTSDEKKSITYDDLRQRNRDEYKDRLSKQSPPPPPGTPSYKDSPFMPQKTWPDRRPSPNQDPSSSEDPSPQAPPKKKRTNMWGDVIED